MPRLINASVLALLAVACGDNNNHGTPADAPPQPHADAAADAAIDAFEFRDAPADPTGISTAINTPDGPANVAINGVTVTYLRPFFSGSDDPAGFMIQANQQGPGLYVTVDPTTTTPALAVGDVVSFTITSMSSVDVERRATAIANLSRSAQGSDVSTLARDVSSATDLLSNIAAYDNTLVSVTGTFGNSFANSGTGLQSAELNTAGITGQSKLTFRVPATLVDQLDMAAACNVVATNIPFGRFNSTAELDALDQTDFNMTSCPAPAIASAIATSATTIAITFTRRIDPATFDANGDQFTFDQGLTVASATLSARTVTLTTSAQTSGTTYTLTFAGTPLKDLMGTAFTPPNPSPTIAGYTVPAGVLINELNANVKSGCDLIELRVTSDGSMGNFKITEREGVVSSGELSFTFPSGFNVTKNSLVMVHLNSASTTCNPNGATQEVNSPTDQASATYAGNYDTAYDFWASDTGLVATDNVITVYDPDGNILDAVLLTTTNTGAADSLGQGDIVAAASQWSPGPTANGMYTATDFSAAAVMGLGSTGTSVTGTATSIQRNADADTNTAADWVTAAQTFGALNSGEAMLPRRPAKR